MHLGRWNCWGVQMDDIRRGRDCYWLWTSLLWITTGWLCGALLHQQARADDCRPCLLSIFIYFSASILCLDAVKYIVNHADVRAIFCVPTSLNTGFQAPYFYYYIKDCDCWNLNCSSLEINSGGLNRRRITLASYCRG